MLFPDMRSYNLEGAKFVDVPTGVFDFKHFINQGPNKRTTQIMCQQMMESLALSHGVYIKNPPISRDLYAEYTRAIPEAFESTLIPSDTDNVANSGKREAYIEQARPYPSWTQLIKPGYEPFPPREGRSRKDRNVRLHFAEYKRQQEDIDAFPDLNKHSEIPDALRGCREVVSEIHKKKHEVARALHYGMDTGMGLPQGTMIEATQIDEGPSLVAPTMFEVDPDVDQIWDSMQYEHDDDSWGTMHLPSYGPPELPLETRMDAVIAWMTMGYRFLPHVPKDMLWWQVGIFTEILLGGMVGRCRYKVKAGLHCASITPWIWQAAKEYKAQYGRPLRRYAGVYFIQPKTTKMAAVLKPFANAATRKVYPPLEVGRLMALSFYATGVLKKCIDFDPHKPLGHDLDASPLIQAERERLLQAA